MSYYTYSNAAAAAFSHWEWVATLGDDYRTRVALIAPPPSSHILCRDKQCQAISGTSAIAVGAEGRSHYRAGSSARTAATYWPTRLRIVTLCLSGVPLRPGDNGKDFLARILALLSHLRGGAVGMSLVLLVDPEICCCLSLGCAFQHINNEPRINPRGRAVMQQGNDGPVD
jgi:hypothetical protein